MTGYDNTDEDDEYDPVATCPECGADFGGDVIGEAAPKSTVLTPTDGARTADILTVATCPDCGDDVELALTVELSPDLPDGFRITASTAPLDDDQEEGRD